MIPQQKAPNNKFHPDRLTQHERRRGYRPEGTRRDLLILVWVNGWPGAEPPRWLCNR